MVKLYCKTVVALLIAMVNTVMVIPYLLSQPSDCMVTLGVLDVLANFPIGYWLAVWIFSTKLESDI
jgi:hypothetical protein